MPVFLQASDVSKGGSLSDKLLSSYVPPKMRGCCAHLLPLLLFSLVTFLCYLSLVPLPLASSSPLLFLSLSSPWPVPLSPPRPRSIAPSNPRNSVRVGNNRFGQLGAWQVSLFRDSISPTSGLGRGSFGGGYANSSMGPAASAPVFSTASPSGVPRYSAVQPSQCLDRSCCCCSVCANGGGKGGKGPRGWEEDRPFCGTYAAPRVFGSFFGR